MSRLKWTPEPNNKPRFERANPQHYDSPQSEAYRDGWERIFKKHADPHCPFSDLECGCGPYADDCPNSSYYEGCESRTECLCEEASCPTTSTNS